MNSRLLLIAIGIVGVIAIVFVVRQTAGSIPSLSGDRLASTIYLGIWAALIGSAVLTSRQRLGHTLKQLVIWLAIFLIIMAAYTQRYELQDFASAVTGGLVPGSPISIVKADGSTQITLIRDNSGHFVARGAVDTAPVTFLVDTGATDIVLSNGDASRAGINTDALVYNIPVSTANGMTTSARIKIGSISIGPIEYRNMTVMIARDGDLHNSLLGMRFINQLRSFEIRGDRMILTK